MAANQTVSQLDSHNQHFDLLTPRNGIVTVFGYGIRVRLDRGHLSIEDGIGVSIPYASDLRREGDDHILSFGARERAPKS
jgi:hypothetical protein